MKEINVDLGDLEVNVDEGDGLQGDEVAAVDEYGWSEEEVKDIAADIVAWVKQQEMDGEPERAKWKTWRRQADGIPKKKEKNTPIINASNASPPLAMIQGQTMAANIINYFNVFPFWVVHPLQEYSDKARVEAKCWTEYLDLLSRSKSDLDWAAKLRTISHEVGVMGRCVMKVPFSVFEWKYKRKVDGVPTDQTVVMHFGPEVVPIQQEDIYYPKEWNDTLYMPKIVHELHLPKHIVEERMNSGVYEYNEDVLNGGRTNRTEAEAESDRIQGRTGGSYETIYDLLEVYFYADADKDGVVEDHIWVIDKTTGVVLRREYNTLGKRPFAYGFYLQRTYELSGKGTGHICEYLQEEVEAVHNIFSDNMKIANMRMFEMKRSVAQSNSEELGPGKIWYTDTGNDIKTLQMGEVFPSILKEEQNLWHISAQATGQSEVQRGFGDPTLGQRDTFRGQAMRMNASKGIFGTICDGLRETFNEVGMLIMYQLVMNKDRVMARERALKRWPEEKLAELERLLSVDISDLPGKFVFRVSSADGSKSDETKMQAANQMAQMYAMYGQQVGPLAQMLLGPQGAQMQAQAPQMWEFYMSLFVGATKMLKTNMQLMGFENVEGMTPNIEGHELMLRIMDEQMMQQAKMMEGMYGKQIGGAGEGVYNGATQGAVGNGGAGPMEMGVGDIGNVSQAGGQGTGAGSGGGEAVQGAGEAY